MRVAKPTAMKPDGSQVPQRQEMHKGLYKELYIRLYKRGP